ncbi:MAG: hypothetical protein HRT61_23150 [Ekhidna sp.]|nr:hypothetical protein [Ekhidna sp.]
MKTEFFKILRVGGFLTVAVFIFGTIVTEIFSVNTQRRNKNLECYGVIDSVKISDNHATPSFLIEGQWRYLGLFGYSIAEEVKKQDSVAKAAGEELLFLYRKDHRDNYRLVLQTTTRKVTYK